jgi:hypothetical protein
MAQPELLDDECEQLAGRRYVEIGSPGPKGDRGGTLLAGCVALDWVGPVLLITTATTTASLGRS